MTRFVAAALLGSCILLTAAARAPRVSYTVAQADRGRFAYYQNCAECHGGDLGGSIGPALAGPDSKLQWETGSYVYGYVTAHMPHGNPGGLPTDEYLAIMSFLYQQHHHDAGRTPLSAKAVSADSAELGY